MIVEAVVLAAVAVGSFLVGKNLGAKARAEVAAVSADVKADVKKL